MTQSCRIAVVLGLVVLPVACGIAIRRDLSALPAGQVGFDDMCGLQGYFDAIEIKTSPPPRVVSAVDLEGAAGGADGSKRPRGGSERFAFEGDFQLKHVRRVLGENWQRLPDGVATASKIEIEVKWAEKAGTKPRRHRLRRPSCRSEARPWRCRTTSVCPSCFTASPCTSSAARCGACRYRS